jgi:hypothetical protein
MHRKQQLGLDSLRRVQGCLDTHADVVGRLKDTEARKQLDAAVDAAVAKAEGQRAAEKSEGPTAGSETVDALEFLARLGAHIPDPGHGLKRC